MMAKLGWKQLTIARAQNVTCDHITEGGENESRMLRGFRHNKRNTVKLSATYPPPPPHTHTHTHTREG
jgi:hypothetical protein